MPRLPRAAALSFIAGWGSIACDATDTAPTRESNGSPSAQRGDASPYAFLRNGGIPYDEMGAAWNNLPYASISLEREGCFGTCPQYEVTFSRGSGQAAGAATFEGRAFVSREGTFEGGISLWDYARLCELLDQLGFRSMNEDYAAQWTDDATTLLRADHVSGSVQVRDYGQQGPAELFALQLAVDATVELIEWTDAESAPSE
jgi:hypothetical protein